MDTRSVSALTDAAPAVFWTDRPDAPEPTEPLVGETEADLAVVGGGFSGLWTALLSLESNPERRVVLVESATCGHGASSRNGGFCSRSLTHGLAQGLGLWPDEIDQLVALGNRNLDEIAATLERFGIDCGFERVGTLEVATEAWQMEHLREEAVSHRRVGDRVTVLDRSAVRARLDSPTFVGGLRLPDETALVDPARLAWGLRRVVLELGATIHERTPVTGVESATRGLVLRTPTGTVRADRVVVATNAYGRPVRRVRRYVIPVYDHVLVTEPLTPEQLDSLGWEGREGVGEAANQFHYYRRTEDDRILWGGYDATYHRGNGIDDRFDQNDHVHLGLAQRFNSTFPQLEGVRFTHRWGGPIATTSRFTATWGTAHDGRLSWVAGYTGLGVGASRFGARVALDLVDGVDSEPTRLTMVRRKPVPFPPEPVRSIVVGVTKRAIQNADERDGRRGPWLKLLDAFGVGFDS